MVPSCGAWPGDQCWGVVRCPSSQILCQPSHWLACFHCHCSHKEPPSHPGPKASWGSHSRLSWLFLLRGFHFKLNWFIGVILHATLGFNCTKPSWSTWRSGACKVQYNFYKKWQTIRALSRQLCSRSFSMLLLNSTLNLHGISDW